METGAKRRQADRADHLARAGCTERWMRAGAGRADCALRWMRAEKCARARHGDYSDGASSGRQALPRVTKCIPSPAP